VRNRVLIIGLLIGIAGAACDSGLSEESSTTTTFLITPTTSTTTTTIDPAKTCEDIAADAADLMADIVEELDRVGFEEFVDRNRWPAELTDLEQRGGILDQQVSQAGCDPGTVQQAALDAIAGVDPDGRIGEILLELLEG